MKNINARISENLPDTGEPVICVGGLQYSALSPELPELEHSYQTLSQPCQEYLACGWENAISEVDEMR